MKSSIILVFTIFILNKLSLDQVVANNFDKSTGANSYSGGLANDNWVSDGAFGMPANAGTEWFGSANGNATGFFPDLGLTKNLGGSIENVEYKVSFYVCNYYEDLLPIEFSDFSTLKIGGPEGSVVWDTTPSPATPFEWVKWSGIYTPAPGDIGSAFYFDMVFDLYAMHCIGIDGLVIVDYLNDTIFVDQCDTISGVFTSDITFTDATIHWDGSADAENYTVQYQISGDTVWQYIESDTNFIIISELEECSKYEYIATAYCPSDSSSSDTLEFQTECDTSSNAINLPLNSVSVNIFPNPSTGIINLELTPGCDYAIQIANIKGQTVYQNEIWNAEKTISIDLQFLADGVYFLFFKQPDQISSTPVIISK